MPDKHSKTFDRSLTGEWMDASGLVLRLLHDDRDGPRHQRFIIGTGGGHTLMISHNVEIAEVVPLGIGDRVTVRGIYEWNEHGGVLHWTHHDPRGMEQGGFVRFRSDEYQ